MIREALAPAKVNLYLHVGLVQNDGYHPVESLMVFADVGDRLRLDSGGNGFSVRGPFSATLAHEADNLVTRARDRFADIFGQAPVGLELEKRLPIAAGLGGGSSDAAAALRLLADERGVSHDDPRLAEIARGLGADVPACLKAEPVVGRGRGDDLSPAPPFASLPALLVNPGAPCPTGAVYRAFDASEVNHSLEAPLPRNLGGPAEVARWLTQTRNDLEPAAIGLTPVVREVLEALAAEPETLLARMSGSGSTVFAIFATPARAGSVAERLKHRHPTWWITACALGAPLRS